MNIPALAIVAGVLIASPLLAAAASGPPESGAVFRCATKDGRTVFSDQPCVGADRVELWKPRAVASGIERSGGPAGAAAPARNAPAVRDDPFVDCQRRGGRFDLAARVCRLPDDAAKAMFKTQ
ncbi:MAG: DUF4124 domain-containing protein [Burkholderiales bacterium]|nr:DUF4124 domain-containing protein [Burkholderiales bacterium]OJX08706.1 MAG: hypothetical protein BGO72_15820 [Burkholderiales bacterium 70-64]